MHAAKKKTKNTLIGILRARNVHGGGEKSFHPYDAVCTAGDDDVPGVPLVPLREQDALDIRLWPAGGVGARQQVALHVPQVDDGPGARRNLTLEGRKKTKNCFHTPADTIIERKMDVCIHRLCEVLKMVR